MKKKQKPKKLKKPKIPKELKPIFDEIEKMLQERFIK